MGLDLGLDLCLDLVLDLGAHLDLQRKTLISLRFSVFVDRNVEKAPGFFVFSLKSNDLA